MFIGEQLKENSLSELLNEIGKQIANFAKSDATLVLTIGTSAEGTATAKIELTSMAGVQEMGSGK